MKFAFIEAEKATVTVAVDARQSEGLLQTFDDVVAAHMEGTVQRVRPKLMTVSTMLVGLVPLLWASGSGADVMKRIAAPMVGGLLTSAFLTLEIIPVLSVHLTWEALLWARAESSLTSTAADLTRAVADRRPRADEGSQPWLTRQTVRAATSSLPARSSSPSMSSSVPNSSSL